MIEEAKILKEGYHYQVKKSENKEVKSKPKEEVKVE